MNKKNENATKQNEQQPINKRPIRKTLLNKLEETLQERKLKQPSESDNDSEKILVSDDKNILIKACKNNIYVKRKMTTNNDNSNNHTRNNKGHVTNEDIHAMRQWFIGNWKEVGVIPFEILTLESFLVLYFGYSYDEAFNLNDRKRKVIEQHYALFLSTVADVTRTQLFLHDNLKSFMNMCRRNFAKQKSYNLLVQSFLKETKLVRTGYLISSEVAALLQKENSLDVKMVNSKTRYHTIVSWLQHQKFVYIPDEFKQSLNIPSELDVFEKHSDLMTYLVGYGSFIFTDIKLSPIGMDNDERFRWFSALNNYFTTQPLLTMAPQIKNFTYQPHLASLNYTDNQMSNRLEVTILVDWEFYDKYKNGSGVVNIHIEPNIVIVNSQELSMTEEDIKRFCFDLTISCQRLTGTKILGNLLHLDIEIRRSLSKMGSFMSQLECAKNKFISQINSGIYKIAAIAGKASGKTSLTDLVTNQLGSNIYIEDSDHFGQFVTYMVEKYSCADIGQLNELLTEQIVVEEATYFSSICGTSEVDNIPSFYNAVVMAMIKDDMKSMNWETLRPVDYQLNFSKLVAKLYTKYYPQIRELYYQLDSGKTLNQKLYENGILNHMHQTGKRLLLQFFHIFSCNYRRKAANVTMRYEPNFDTDISLYTRIINKQINPSESMADALLKMYYDQSAEYITSICDPSAFMRLFGLIPVLSTKNTLCFEFRTHLDVTG